MILLAILDNFLASVSPAEVFFVHGVGFWREPIRPGLLSLVSSRAFLVGLPQSLLGPSWGRRRYDIS